MKISQHAKLRLEERGIPSYGTVIAVKPNRSIKKKIRNYCVQGCDVNNNVFLVSKQKGGVVVYVFNKAFDVLITAFWLKK
jgi:hypothetical protein